MAKAGASIMRVGDDEVVVGAAVKLVVDPRVEFVEGAAIGFVVEEMMRLGALNPLWCVEAEHPPITPTITKDSATRPLSTFTTLRRPRKVALDQRVREHPQRDSNPCCRLERAVS
jgi:hypothetical protein